MTDEMHYHTKIAMQAAERAARKVIEQAHRDNTPMPIWDGEKVVYKIPPLPDKTNYSKKHNAKPPN